MGLKQKEGTRLIDDFSEFGHNVCTTSHEKLSWGIDDVVTWARAHARLKGGAIDLERGVQAGAARGGPRVLRHLRVWNPRRAKAGCARPWAFRPGSRWACVLQLGAGGLEVNRSSLFAVALAHRFGCCPVVAPEPTPRGG